VVAAGRLKFHGEGSIRTSPELRKRPEVSCLYAGRPDVVSPLPQRDHPSGMDSPTLDSLRQEIDTIDGQMHG